MGKRNAPVVASLSDQVVEFTRKHQAEAIFATTRVTRRCSESEHQQNYGTRLSYLVGLRERLRYGDPEYQDAQDNIDAHARMKLPWDPESMPPALFQDLVRHVVVGQDRQFAQPTNAARWDLLILFQLLTLKDISHLRVVGTLAEWETPKGLSRVCRRDALTQAQGDDMTWRWLQSRVELALQALRQRQPAESLDDLLTATTRPLQRLFIALTMLRNELLDPGKHLDQPSWGVAVRAALVQAQNLSNNWPAGACDGPALRARDDIGGKIAMTLAEMNRDHRGRERRWEASIRECMNLLDAHIRHIGEGWPEIPLPHLSMSTPLANKWLLSYWYSGAWAEFGPTSAVRFDVKRLRRAAMTGKLGEGFKQPKLKRKMWKFHLDEVCKCPEFALYAEVWTSAFEDGYQPRRSSQGDEKT